MQQSYQLIPVPENSFNSEPIRGHLRIARRSQKAIYSQSTSNAPQSHEMSIMVLCATSLRAATKNIAYCFDERRVGMWPTSALG
jgi:hypothetical protein